MVIPTSGELLDPIKVLEEAGIRAGMSVADFGCGTVGHFVFPAAKLVGAQGKVYAVDILKSVLSGITSRMKMEGATNVETLWGDLERANGIRLPDGALDIGLVVNNLFMAKNKEALLKECGRMVKPGGRLVVVDWKPTGGAIGPDPALRVSADGAKALAAAAGLKLEKEFSPGEYHYGLVYAK